jgi:hypothetical protein
LLASCSRTTPYVLSLARTNWLGGDKVSELPFGLPGRFWRGCLHAHSSRSDGGLPPQEVCQCYRAAGYDFTVISDHFLAEYGFPLTDTRQYHAPGFTTLPGAELHAPATEHSDEWHILAVGLPAGFAPPLPGETGQELARRARASGAFIGMAHPAAKLLTLADAESLDAAHAVEVYNAHAAWVDRGDSWHLCDLLLSSGRQLGCYAADDAHFQPGEPPAGLAWVQVRAESLEPDALLAALKAGHYYSSTGPEIYEITLSDDKVMVRCSPASRIVVSGGVPGARIVVGQDLTGGSLEPGSLRRGRYVRVTVIDHNGGRAWSNPIWLH